MIALSSFIWFQAQRTPERMALVYGEERISYAELMRRIEGTAGWLTAQGIGPGDVVALYMKNSPAFLESPLRRWRRVVAYLSSGRRRGRLHCTARDPATSSG